MQPPTHLSSTEPFARAAGAGRVLPTFRPDAVVNLDAPGWHANIDRLSRSAAVDVTDYRAPTCGHWNSAGTSSVRSARPPRITGVLAPDTAPLSPVEAEALFQRALQGQACTEDARRFTAHMLMGNGSYECGGWTGHANPSRLAAQTTTSYVFRRFVADRGGDIPIQTEYHAQPAASAESLWQPIPL